MQKKIHKQTYIRPGAYVAKMPEVLGGANVIKSYRVHLVESKKIGDEADLEDENISEEQPQDTQDYIENIEEPMMAEDNLTAENTTATEEISENTPDTEETTEAEEPANESKPEEPKKNHTFWENDEGDRPLLSQADYEKFLRENNLNI